jgi:hypothetical protein
MDLELIETGNGGDLVKKGKDLSVIHGFQNMPYLALFGGNVEASTPSKRNKGELGFDYWGNSLLMDNDPEQQFNSLTERTLKNVPLTSSGRLLIEQAVVSDLDFMKSFATIAVTVSIVSVDRVKILVQIKELENLEQKEFVFIWDKTGNEVTDNNNGGGGTNPPIQEGVFDDGFDDSFN